MSVAEHLGAMFDVGGSTLVLFTLICGSAVFLISNKVASVFTLIAIFPMAMLLSLVTYYACTVMGLFDPKKMADWLIWSIMAATSGTMIVIGSTVIISSAIDRQPA
jgi:hypothetical protein